MNDILSYVTSCPLFSRDRRDILSQDTTTKKVPFFSSIKEKTNDKVFAMALLLLVENSKSSKIRQ